MQGAGRREPRERASGTRRGGAGPTGGVGKALRWRGSPAHDIHGVRSRLETSTILMRLYIDAAVSGQGLRFASDSPATRQDRRRCLLRTWPGLP